MAGFKVPHPVLLLHCSLQYYVKPLHLSTEDHLWRTYTTCTLRALRPDLDDTSRSSFRCLVRYYATSLHCNYGQSRISCCHAGARCCVHVLPFDHRIHHHVWRAKVLRCLLLLKIRCKFRCSTLTSSRGMLLDTIQDYVTPQTCRHTISWVAMETGSSPAIKKDCLSSSVLFDPLNCDYGDC